MYDDVVPKVKNPEKNGRSEGHDPAPSVDGAAASGNEGRPASGPAAAPVRQADAKSSAGRPSSVAKVSHTLSLELAEKLEQFAFFQRVSESAVIEHSLSAFFAQSTDDAVLGEQLRSGGAGRRRKR